MKKTPFLILILFLALTGSKCKAPTETENKPAEPDTTSQNFTYTIETLGGYSTHIFCIEIVSDTLIYVGGYITPFGFGTTNQDDKVYNLAVWNGKEWKFDSIMFQFDDGSNIFQKSPIKQIKVFEDGSMIMMSIGAECIFKNGNSIIYKSAKAPVDHFWARNKNDIYFVGSNGSATHYNGSNFIKLVTGTTADLNDLWGNDKFVYATGEDELGAEQLLLEYDGTSWKVINRYNFNNSDHDPKYENIGLTLSVYLTEKNNLYLNGGLYDGQVRKMTSRNPFRTEILHDYSDYYFLHNEPFFARRIRGNADNDIYASSSDGAKFYHFNGKRWKLFEIPGELGYWSLNLTVKGNMWVNSLEPDLGITRIIMGKRF